ncbi:Endopolyphosphatase [Gryganskiella cystojenkinii]|nr:Endopolyphosphatase [Gryganskiella cystojenkinii]
MRCASPLYRFFANMKPQSRLATRRRSRGPRKILLCSVAIACLCATTVVTSDAAPRPLQGRFLQITDIHPDEHYVDGAAVSSSCHTVVGDGNSTVSLALGGQRKGRYHYEKNKDEQESQNNITITLEGMNKQRPGLVSMSVLSKTTMDDGTVGTGVGGVYGAPNTICDSPFALANATFDWIDKNLVDNIDFVVWSGDNARHDSDNTHPRTQDQINQMNDAIAKRFLQAFPISPETGRRLPIVPSIGNNDVYPHNIMNPGPSPILQHYSNIWSEFIPEGQMHTFRRGGYYSSEVVPGRISVFGLNTLYFYVHNAAVDGCKIDDEPGTEQMDWMETELASLRNRKMVAYLTGHVPPEKKSYSPSCYKRYTKIALEYQDVIVGHLYGHANIDHFFLLSNNKKNKKAMATTTKTTTMRRRTTVMETLSGDEEAFEDVEEVVEEEEEEDLDIAEDDDDEEEEISDKIDVMEEEEYDPFHTFGLTTYLEDLWKQYSDIPKKVKLDNYAVVQVSPSVVPTYYPTLRVFSYQLQGVHNSIVKMNPPLMSPDELDNQDEEMNDQAQRELEQYFADQLNDLSSSKSNNNYNDDKDLPWDNSDFPTWGGEDDKGDKDDDKDKDKNKDGDHDKKKKKKGHPRAAPVSTFGFPLSFIQYWSNITIANLDPENKTPQFVIEYSTKEDYGLQDLGVASWLGLARKIAKEKDLKATYLTRMVVQTGAETLLQ